MRSSGRFSDWRVSDVLRVTGDTASLPLVVSIHGPSKSSGEEVQSHGVIPGGGELTVPSFLCVLRRFVGPLEVLFTLMEKPSVEVRKGSEREDHVLGSTHLEREARVSDEAWHAIDVAVLTCGSDLVKGCVDGIELGLKIGIDGGTLLCILHALLNSL